MALIEEQQADKEQEIYSEFINALKSPVTKETYDIHIKISKILQLYQIIRIINHSRPTKTDNKIHNVIKRKRIKY